MVYHNLMAIRIKSNANYTCRECGSTELVQGHHVIPGDDSSIIPLCAGCHADKHPNVPRALFFARVHQPYWYNKSAATLAKEWNVHSRTVIRAARGLKIPRGELKPWDEELIKQNIKKLQPKRTIIPPRKRIIRGRGKNIYLSKYLYDEIVRRHENTNYFVRKAITEALKKELEKEKRR